MAVTDKAWEQSLKYLVPNDSDVTGRALVAGDSSNPWIKSIDYREQHPKGGGYEIPTTPDQWDIYLQFDIQSISGTASVGQHNSAYGTDSSNVIYIGINLDWEQFNPNSTWQKFIDVGDKLLDPLVTGGGEANINGGVATSIPSFTSAEEMLIRTQQFLDHWGELMTSQSKNVGSGADLSGDFAQKYQSLLENAGQQLRILAEQVYDSNIQGYLESGKTEIANLSNGLLQAFTHWRPPAEWKSAAGMLNNPLGCVHMALAQANISLTYNNVGNVDHFSGFGQDRLDVESDDFRLALDKQAKSLWDFSLQQGLDPTATQLQSHADATFSSMAARFPKPKLGPIASSYSSTSEQDKNKQQLDDLQKQLLDQQNQNAKDQGNFQKQQQDDYKQQQQDQQQKQQDLQKQNEQGGGGTTGGNLGVGNGNGNGNLDQLNKTDQNGQNGNKNSLGNLNTGGNNGLGGNNHQLNQSPPPLQNFSTGGNLGLGGGSGGGGGGKIGGPNDPLAGKSSVINPDGTLAKGPDGSTITVPNGSKVNPNGTVTGPDGKLVTGPDGQPVKVDPHAQVQPNVAVRNPDGSLYTAPNGSSIYGPPGSIAGPNGSILDPKGSAMFGPGGRLLGPAGSVSSGLGSSKFGLGGMDSSLKTTGPTGPPEIGDPTKRSTVNGSALEEAMRKPSAMQTESQLKNGQNPVMPPPMGGGGAGGPGDKERNRNTWLAEEAEKWGTEGGFTAAIGR
ncbi:hypothetical protein [Saccharopolyspora shandongensis]|uniref:hypothetical protein n=1 Tax=Saccharopolyspora shandongensis TaxID=418495 RepID=UPI0033D1AB7A